VQTSKKQKYTDSHHHNAHDWQQQVRQKITLNEIQCLFEAKNVFAPVGLSRGSRRNCMKTIKIHGKNVRQDQFLTLIR